MSLPTDTIEIDPAESKEDFETLTYSTDTSTLRSSIYAYTYENGRRYHALQSGTYLLPNDDKEQDRLDLVHHVWLLFLKGHLFSAPLKCPRTVLDLGTGTGAWAADFADQHPSAHIYGTDLSPIQPVWTSDNLSFQIDDFEDPWTWPRNHFDLIHIRNLLGSVKDWGKLIKNAYNHIQPNGYLELHECDLEDMYSDANTYDQSGAMANYFRLTWKALSQIDVAFQPKDFQSLLEKAGFVDVSFTVRKLPLGPWPKDRFLKELGRWGIEMMNEGLDAYALAPLTRILGMGEEEAKEVIEEARKEVTDRRQHRYWKMYIIHAEKPRHAGERERECS